MSPTMPPTGSPSRPARELVAAFKRANWSWLVLPIGLAVSVMAHHFAQQVVETETAFRFQAAARDARHLVETEMRAHTQVVFGLRALFSANPALTRDEFAHYVEGLDLPSRSPAFAAISFARHVPAHERAAFEQRMREDPALPPEVRRQFRIRAPQGLPYHFVIEYVHPAREPHLATVGIDITAEPQRRPALLAQVESGELASSGIPITQVSRNLDSNVLPMRLAVYRYGSPLNSSEDRWKALVGSVGTSFHVRTLFDRALVNSSGHLRLRVYDIGPASAPADMATPNAMLLYDNAIPDKYMASPGVMARGARLEHTQTVEWATRRWALQFTGDEAFFARSDARLPAMIMAGGGVTTLLLFAWLHTLARSRAHALAARRAQSQFISNMSHELRTPLNAILGYAQILGMASNLSERQKAGVHTIKASGDHLLSLIDDVLDTARIEAGKLALHDTDVEMQPFIEDVADIVRVRAREKGLDFVIDTPTPLPRTAHVDEKRLRQVLLNLLGNAVKFTDQGRVVLRVHRVDSVVPAGEARLRFEVEDTGIGMDVQQQSLLFQPFQQVSDPLRRRGGAGLGLAISRQLVRLMGSDIELQSSPGRGSTFAFELQLPVSDTRGRPHTPEQVPNTRAGEHRTVLVVDDSADNRALLADALRPMGFTVVEAPDGEQGLLRARTMRPDIILMDNAMPKMTGLDAMRRLRTWPGFEHTPVIVVSASPSREDIAKAMSAGATAFLPKPFQIATLIALLEEHLGVPLVSCGDKA